MKQLKNKIIILLVFTMIVSMPLTGLAATYQSEAEAMSALGLLKGTGNGLDLESSLTRLQGAVLAIRLQGKETTALSMTDAEVNSALSNVEDILSIPGWGKKYAAYSLVNGIISGVSKSAAGKIKFSAVDPLSGRQFITMVLRSMGYTSSDVYATCTTRSVDVGMLTSVQANAFATKKQLIRDDSAGIMYGAVKKGIASNGRPMSFSPEPGIITLPNAVSEINAGDYLNFGKYYGEPILWKCASKSKEGITLASEYILCQKAYDASESGKWKEGSDNLQKFGSNVWSNSNIREWLNSTSSTVNFTTQPPNRSAVASGTNAYSDEPGFLSNFTQSERDLIKAVNHEGVSDMVYLPSLAEVSLYYGNSDSQRIRKMTDIGIQKGEYKKDGYNPTWTYWTRSPNPDYNYSVTDIRGGGNSFFSLAYLGMNGIVPAIQLSSYTPIKGSGTISDPWSY